jgi:hypothetical protein
MREQIRAGIVHVGRALREPEEFAERWRAGAVRHNGWVWTSLLATAILGTVTYGGCSTTCWPHWLGSVNW